MSEPDPGLQAHLQQLEQEFRVRKLQSLPFRPFPELWAVDLAAR